jgi:hypothetical protein
MTVLRWKKRIRGFLKIFFEISFKFFSDIPEFQVGGPVNQQLKNMWPYAWRVTGSNPDGDYFPFIFLFLCVVDQGFLSHPTDPLCLHLLCMCPVHSGLDAQIETEDTYQSISTNTPSTGHSELQLNFPEIVSIFDFIPHSTFFTPQRWCHSN